MNGMDGDGRNAEFPSAGELSERLNALLSDPESMGRLMKMASGLASSGLFSGMPGMDPDGNTKTSEQSGEDGTQNRAGDTNTSGQKSGLRDGSGTGNDGFRGKDRPGGGIRAGGRHAALLRALRPYMNEGRQMRIDQMLQLLQLAEAAEAVLRMQGMGSGGNGTSSTAE